MLSVLSLLPASKAREKLTGSSLLDEEIPAIADSGVSIHTISHRSVGLERDFFHRHCYPRARSIIPSTRAFTDCIRYRHCDAFSAKSPLDRFQLARKQRSIAAVIRSENIDLIHSHWARPSGTAGAFAKMLTGVPLVITLRGADVFKEESIEYGNTGDPWYCRRLRHAFDLADKIIGVSSQIIDRAVELGADRSKTIVIPKGVHQDRFTPGDRSKARQDLGLDDRPTILFVGALGKWKGIDTLLPAFAAAKRRVPDAQLVFCGKGDLETTIRQFRETNHLEDSIFLQGYIGRDQLPRYFQACNVFVLPSLTEGSGNVLLEAASCERASIGSRVGGIPDYIFEGETGFLFQKQNHTDLSERLCQLLLDPAAADQMGKAGRDRVMRQFRYSQMIDQTVQVYHDVLSAKC